MDGRSLQSVPQGGPPTVDDVHPEEDHRGRGESSFHPTVSPATMGYAKSFAKPKPTAKKPNDQHPDLMILPMDPENPEEEWSEHGNGGTIDGSRDLGRCSSSSSLNAESGEHAGEGGIEHLSQGSGQQYLIYCVSKAMMSLVICIVLKPS